MHPSTPDHQHPLTFPCQPIYYDTHNLEGLRSEVYAASVEIDYTSLLGGTSRIVLREDWVNEVGGILGHFASTQHVTS